MAEGESKERESGAEAPRGRLDEVRAVVRSLGRALGLLYSVGPGGTVAFAVATAIDALVPAAMAVVAKLIVDSVVGRSMGGALTWVGVECGLVVLRSILYHAEDYLRSLLGARLSIRVNTLIVDKALDLAAAHFEDSSFSDRLARAAKEAGTRPIHVVTHGFTTLREAVRLASYLVILFGFSPAVAAAILAGTAPQLWAQTWAASESFRVQFARTFDERRADYLRELLLRETFVKEVKLFALGRFLLGRYLELQERFFEQDRRVLRRTVAGLLGSRLLATLAFYGCYVVVAMAAVAGRITLGDMTMLLLAVRGAQEAFEAALNAVAKVYEGNLYMANLFDYLATPADEPFHELRERDEERPAAPPEVVFESVSFTYPGTERETLREVSLRIAPGETLALVGRNGAGKTTLVKLLGRLYEPTSGRILLDGTDVSSLPPSEVRRRVGVIFQDFVQYHLTAGENVGVGWLPRLDEKAEIEEATRRGGADGFVARLPKAYDTVLGRYYGGAQLSIGQWQRLALARAFMRRSDLLILDEPTAALDAESEAALFERLGELKEGRTAVLITHRFSSVRFADRIVVLDDGRVVEQGTHAELLAKGGLYAKLWTAQAAAYELERGRDAEGDAGRDRAPDEDGR